MGKLFLLVIVLLGIGMVVPNVRDKMLVAVAPVMDTFKAKLVPMRLNAMADQVAARVSRGEGYPPQWEQWLEAEFSGEPQDPWGNVYYMRQDRTGFTVGSSGPDGIPHTPDDIMQKRRLGK